MILAVIKSDVLSAVLKDRENFPAAQIYFAGFGGFKRTEQGYFVSEVRDKECVIRLALEDYLFNEQPSCNKIWDVAEKILGKKEIDMKLIKVVQL